MAEPAVQITEWARARKVGSAPGDGILLARLAEDDEAALDALLDRYWRVLVRYAIRRTGSHDAACDIAQDVFCTLWSRRGSLRPDGSVRALLFRMAHNLTVTRFRRQRARRRAVNGYAERWTGTATPKPAERAEMNAAIEHAISLLPARRREVFLLRMMDDLSYEEIAAVMGTSRQTVANQLSRALATLRPALAHLLD